MSLPFFYLQEYDPSETIITLDEDTSKHVISVLRMKPGGLLHLTDGKGNLLVAEIVNDYKKQCKAEVKAISYQPQAKEKITIAISILKNTDRFEWFLEKATEIGIQEIIPLICKRTEKKKLRTDRMKNILVNAMLQSQQVWLPALREPQQIDDVISKFSSRTDAEEIFKSIAYCSDEEKQSVSQPERLSLAGNFQVTLSDCITLIGPEGDFTKEEIDLAIHHKFIPVTLGKTRLRSETAGVVAAALLKNSNR